MRKSLRTPFNQCCMTPNRRPWVEALVALLTIPNVSGLTSWNVRKRQVQKHAPDQASKRAKRGWRNLNRLQNHLTQVKPFSNYKIQMETWKRQRELCTVSQTMQPAFYGHWSFHIGPCGVAADRLLFCCSCWWDDFAAVPAVDKSTCFECWSLDENWSKHLMAAGASARCSLAHLHQTICVY